MRTPSRRLSPVAALLCLSALAGCGNHAARAPRPAPGDRVVPELYPAAPWQAGGQAALTARFVAQAAEGGREYLRPEEVPEGAAIRATVRFFDGDREVATLSDVALTPPSC